MRAAGAAFGAPGRIEPVRRNRSQIEILQLREALRAKLDGERLRIEIGEQGFAQGRDARGKRLRRLAALARISLNRLVIVEDDLRLVERGDETQRGEDRLARQIGKHAEPEEEGGLLRVEAAVGETLAQVLALEIEGDEGEKMRRLEALLRKPRALPGLSRRMIDLEDAQP